MSAKRKKAGLATCRRHEAAPICRQGGSAGLPVALRFPPPAVNLTALQFDLLHYHREEFDVEGFDDG